MILLPVLVVTTLLCYEAVAQQNPQPAAEAAAPKTNVAPQPGVPQVVNLYIGRGQGTGGHHSLGAGEETSEEDHQDEEDQDHGEDIRQKKKNGKDHRVEVKVAEEVAEEKEEDVVEEEEREKEIVDRAEVGAVAVEIGEEIEVAAAEAKKKTTTTSMIMMTTEDDISMEIDHGGIDIIETEMDNVVSILERS
ncbi:hypothetical protein Aduo_012567 [Ancylostoma duodenale]